MLCSYSYLKLEASCDCCSGVPGELVATGAERTLHYTFICIEGVLSSVVFFRIPNDWKSTKYSNPECHVPCGTHDHTFFLSQDSILSVGHVNCCWSSPAQSFLYILICVVSPSRETLFICHHPTLSLGDIWRSGGIAPPFLTSALDGGEWSAACSGRYTPREIYLGTHWIGGWYGPHGRFERCEEKKLPWQESNPGRPSHNT
jgi:hypothetical protein